MKILTIIGLSASSANTFVEPLTYLSNVSQVFVVRDTPGAELPKVRHYCPPKWVVKFPVTKTLFKLLLAVYATLTQKPDVILATYLYPHAFIGLIIAKIARKPVSVSLIAGENSTRHWGDLTEKAFVSMLRWCNLVTVTGSVTRDHYLGKGLFSQKVFCLPNVIDSRNFYPLSIAKEYDVVYIGRLSPEKRLDILLEAVARVKQELPNIRVGIAGDGPARKSLERLSAGLNISENVSFVGFFEDGNHFLNKGRVFVLTSRGEGFPLALLEAMAAGLACITSNVGDISDLAVDGENCILIDDYQDVDSCARAIIRLLEDKEFYEKLSRNALKVRDSHSLETSAARWTEALKTMLPSSPSDEEITRGRSDSNVLGR